MSLFLCLRRLLSKHLTLTKRKSEARYSQEAEQAKQRFKGTKQQQKKTLVLQPSQEFHTHLPKFQNGDATWLCDNVFMQDRKGVSPKKFFDRLTLTWRSCATYGWTITNKWASLVSLCYLFLFVFLARFLFIFFSALLFALFITILFFPSFSDFWVSPSRIFLIHNSSFSTFLSLVLFSFFRLCYELDLASKHKGKQQREIKTESVSLVSLVSWLFFVHLNRFGLLAFVGLDLSVSKYRISAVCFCWPLLLFYVFSGFSCSVVFSIFGRSGT